MVLSSLRDTGCPACEPLRVTRALKLGGFGVSALATDLAFSHFRRVGVVALDRHARCPTCAVKPLNRHDPFVLGPKIHWALG